MANLKQIKEKETLFILKGFLIFFYKLFTKSFFDYSVFTLLPLIERILLFQQK
jgi:hypothetical protein